MSQNKFGTRVHADAAIVRHLMKDIGSNIVSSGTVKAGTVDVSHTFFVTFDTLTHHASDELMTDRTHGVAVSQDDLALLREVARSGVSRRDASSAFKLRKSEPVPLAPDTITVKDIRNVLLNRLRAANFDLKKVEVKVQKSEVSDRVWQVAVHHTHAIDDLPIRSKNAFNAALDRDPIKALNARDKLQHGDLKFEFRH